MTKYHGKVVIIISFRHTLHTGKLLFRVSDPRFFADPGKNLHADPDPNSRGNRGVKRKKKYFFFTFQMILNNFLKI